MIPIFEIEESQQLPMNKSDLLTLFDSKQLIWFHFQICPACHTIPNGVEWLRKDNNEDMRVFTTVKRQGAYKHWEPIYIGTDSEPQYDERLSWDGKGDKMTQAHIMCVLDYDFNVLSNAFLIHKPGIKTMSQAMRPKFMKINNARVQNEIWPEIDNLYGEREGCPT